MQILGINTLNFYNFKNPLFAAKNREKEDMSFGHYGVDGGKVQRFFARFPCPCCGIPHMLTYKDIKQPLHMPDNTPSKKIIPILARHEKSMHYVEKEVFGILKSLSKTYPQKNLRELLDTQRSTYLKILHLQQKDILRRLRRAGKYLSQDEEKILEKTLKETEEILNDKTSSEQFKRRIFVGKVKYATENFKEKGIVKQIFEIAEEMPKASNNIAAFIVKHTEKKPATGQERTSSDIVWGLLSPSLLTIEHIKVRSKNVKHGGGKNVMTNFLPECARDNNERSSMRLDEFAKLHPEFYGKHLQFFLDKAAKKINREHAMDFIHYPRRVIKTLYRESNGQIKAKVPRIDIKNA